MRHRIGMGVCNVISLHACLHVCLLFSCVNAAVLTERRLGGERSTAVGNLASASEGEGTTANRTYEREAMTTSCPKSVFGNESCEDFATEPRRSVASKSSNDSGPLLGQNDSPVTGEASKELDSTEDSFVSREEKTLSKMTSSSTASTSDAPDASNRSASFGTTASTSDAPDASNRSASFGTTASTSDAPDASNRSASFGTTASTSDAPDASNRSASFGSTSDVPDASNRSASFGSTASTSDAPDASNRSASFGSTSTDSVVAEREVDLLTPKVQDASVETTTASRASSIVSCPSSGFCPLRWLMARDQCIHHNNCSHSEMCCRIRCSKTCIKIAAS